MEEKNKNTKKGNKNISKKTTEKFNTKKELKEKAEVKGLKSKKQENKKNSKESKPAVTNNEMKNLIKIVLVITAVFLIFYGITTLVTNKDDNNNTDSKEVTIQYDEILLGSLFDQPASDYYVLVTKEDDEYAAAYSTYVSKYSSKENAIRVYTSNLDNGFNKSFEAEESKTNTSTGEETVIKDQIYE